MKSISSMLMAGAIALSGAMPAHGQEGRAPRGYIFFAPRNRASTEATSLPKRAAPVTPASAATPPATATTEPLPEAHPTDVAKPPAVRTVTWGTLYSPGATYPAGPSTAGSNAWYGSATPHYPLHGYRYTYDWAGHTYSYHCFTGYRGECYEPGWNDARRTIFESRCGRGSFLDRLWHRGGWERPCCQTCCPYVCDPPYYYTHGFPPEAYGAPGRSGGASKVSPYDPNPSGSKTAPPKPAERPLAPTPEDPDAKPPTPKPEA
jgi:hypothetical protein